MKEKKEVARWADVLLFSSTWAAGPRREQLAARGPEAETGTTNTCSSGRALCQLSLKEHQLVGVANGIQVLDMMVGDIEHRYELQA
jgi:hypothetical protein